MIKNGLNVGDTFEDCGGFYRVAALSGPHYISERITKEEYEKAHEVPEEQPSEETVKEPEEQPKQENAVKTRRASSK